MTDHILLSQRKPNIEKVINTQSLTYNSITVDILMHQIQHQRANREIYTKRERVLADDIERQRKHFDREAGCFCEIGKCNSRHILLNCVSELECLVDCCGNSDWCALLRGLFTGNRLC